MMQVNKTLNPVVSSANIGAVKFEVSFKKPLLLVQNLKSVSPLESLVSL